MSYLSACNTTTCSSHFENTLKGDILGRVWITHTGMTEYGHPAHSPCHGNMLTNIVYCISLFKFPRESPEQSVWSQHMLLLLLEPPGQLSWENTELGSGSLRPDPSLWTPEAIWIQENNSQRVVQSPKLERRDASNRHGSTVQYWIHYVKSWIDGNSKSINWYI